MLDYRTIVQWNLADARLQDYRNLADARVEPPLSRWPCGIFPVAG